MHVITQVYKVRCGISSHSFSTQMIMIPTETPNESEEVPRRDVKVWTSSCKRKFRQSQNCSRKRKPI